MTSTYRQELPPPNGYQKIVYEKIPLKGPMVTWKKLGLGLAVMLYGAYNYRIAKQRLQDEDFERAASRMAIIPLLSAEKDRAILKHWKLLRDQEAELMKNVPGWETGTLYGEPIWKTLKPNDWYVITEEEIFAHNSINEKERLYLHTKFR